MWRILLQKASSAILSFHSENDKTSLPRKPSYLIVNPNLISKFTHLFPLFIKESRFVFSSFLSFPSQWSEHCWLHAARQQPDESHTAGNKDSEGRGETRDSDPDLTTVVLSIHPPHCPRWTTPCTSWTSVRRPSCSRAWTSTPRRASRTSRISMMRPSTLKPISRNLKQRWKKTNDHIRIKDFNT